MKAMTFPFWRPCWPPLLNTTSPVRKAASWLAAVYLLGMAIGALAGQQIFIHVHASAPLSSQARHAHFVENLARDVSLTHVRMKTETAMTGKQSTNEAAARWLSHDQTSNIGRQLESTSDVNWYVFYFFSDMIVEM